MNAKRLGLTTTLLAGLGLSAASSAVTLYSTSYGRPHLYSIDTTTLVATNLGEVGLSAEGLAFVGNTLYGISGDRDEFWNLTSPPGFKVGDTGDRDGIDAGLDYDPVTGIMYNLNGHTDSKSTLYRIDLSTGSATFVGSANVFLDNLAIDSAGTAYAIDGFDTDALYRVNLGTGEATFVGPLDVGDLDSLFGLTFAEGVLYAVEWWSGNFYTVNTSTGKASLLGQATEGGVVLGLWEGLAARSVHAVPEPATLALFGLGLAGLGFSRRRAH